MKGTPKNEIVASMPTVRSNMLSDPATQQAFHKELDQALMRLLISGSFYENDLRSCKKKAIEIIPLPSVKVSSAPRVSSSLSPATLARLKAKFPAL